METDRKAPSNDADADACDDGADDIGEEETEPETVAGLLRSMIAQGACQRLVSLLCSPSPALRKASAALLSDLLAAEAIIRSTGACTDNPTF